MIVKINRSYKINNHIYQDHLYVSDFEFLFKYIFIFYI